MTNKSENYFKKYLKNISDSQLHQFYDDVDWTPFPVLVIKEYQRRHKPKDKGEVLEKLKIQADLTKKKSLELKKLASAKGSKANQKLKSKTIRKVKKTVKAARNLTKSSEKNLAILEKLGELKKKGIITNSEFQEKKKEILKKI